MKQILIDYMSDSDWKTVTAKLLTLGIILNPTMLEMVETREVGMYDPNFLHV